MTELEATNLLLEAVGSDAVNSITGSTHPDVNGALRVLRRKAKSELRKGWWFNTDYGVDYEPNEDSEIIVPQNIGTLRMEEVTHINRNGKLYDTINQTYKFTGVQTAYKQIRLPQWDEVDGLLQDYIAYLAAVEFIISETGDRELQQSYGRDAGLAFVEVKKTQLQMKGFNIFNQRQYRKVRSGVRPAVNRQGAAGTLVYGTLKVNRS